MLNLFFSFRRTERPERTGATKILFDGDGHDCRWRWTLVAHKHAVVVSWHAQKVIVRSDLAGEAEASGWTQTRYFYQGTDRTAMNSLVPFPSGSTRSNRAMTRPKPDTLSDGLGI